MIMDTGLAPIIARIPAFAGAIKISSLGGGLTNRNYRVDTTDNSYVLRIGDPSSELLGINRDHERINTQKAAQAGVGPSVVDSIPNEHVLVISWIEARTLHAADFQSDPALIKRVATSIKKLHGAQPFECEFDFPKLRKKYLKTAMASGFFIPDHYLEMEALIIAMEEKMAKTAEDLVPCNNDLLAENFMDDGNTIWIIDYEYSGQNEASFEIGNLASEISLSDNLLAMLCDAYWKRKIPAKYARARAWSMIARYGWVMWASIQEAVSPIDFDFRTWGMRKWNSVFPELRDAQYQHILENI